jgi:5-formyltetrahydrofolate cyclo-ligase
LHDLNQLRQSIRAQRRALTPKQQISNSFSMSKILCRTTLFRNSSRVAIYIENDGEIAVSQLPIMIGSKQKRYYLPALAPILPNRLWFSEYRVGDSLVLNKFGIPEPDTHNKTPMHPHGLDLVLVPLVAFDANCNRVGMGGGFYDRTFSYLKNRNRWRKPKLIGVAHELQKVDSIQPREWDIPLDGVVTELNLYRQEC